MFAKLPNISVDFSYKFHVDLIRGTAQNHFLCPFQLSYLFVNWLTFCISPEELIMLLTAFHMSFILLSKIEKKKKKVYCKESKQTSSLFFLTVGTHLSHALSNLYQAKFLG